MEGMGCEGLKEVIRGDARARDAFVRRYDFLVRCVARRISLKGDDIAPEDIEMELWRKVFENECALLRSFKGRGSFEGYLRCCLACRAVDIARSISRSEKRRRDFDTAGQSFDYRDTVAWGISGENLFSNGFETSELISILKEAVSELPSESRLLITLLYYDSASPAAVAAVLSLRSKATVYTRKFRILTALRTAVLRKMKRLSRAA